MNMTSNCTDTDVNQAMGHMFTAKLDACGVHTDKFIIKMDSIQKMKDNIVSKPLSLLLLLLLRLFPLGVVSGPNSCFQNVLSWASSGVNVVIGINSTN